MKTLKILYLIPVDRQFNRRYKKGIETAIIDFQRWCSSNTQGYTFRLFKPIVKELRTGNTSNWYFENYTNKLNLENFIEQNKEKIDKSLTKDDLFKKYIWLIFIDAPLKTDITSNRIICLGENYLSGFIGEHPDEKYKPRWIGKMGKEIGQAFGLKHPGESNKDALMQYGYAKYPNCYLTRENKRLLMNSPFLYDDFFSTRVIYNEYKKERYLYNTGYYININGQKWEERLYSNQVYHYKEVKREANIIYLKDKSRKISVKLDLNKKISEYSEDDEVWHKSNDIELPKQILLNAEN